MKVARVLLITAACLVAALLAGVAIALIPGVQTWALQRTLSRHPEWRLSIGRISAGFGRLTLTDVRYTSASARVTAPSITAELPLFANLAHRRLTITHAVANGWTVQLLDAAATPTTAGAKPAAAAEMAPGTRVPATAAPTAGGSVARRYQGVLPALELPFDLEVDRGDATGTLILAHNQGRAAVHVSATQLAAGRNGRIEIAANASLADAAVAGVQWQATVRTSMPTPRTFAQIGADISATASGPGLDGAVGLRGRLDVSRTADGEAYVIAVNGRERSLIDISAQFSPETRRLAGKWRLDVQKADVAPFVLGRALPEFVARGEGTVESDAALTAVHANGRIEGNADRLAALNARFAAVGALGFRGQFDLGQHEGVITVNTAELAVTSGHPVLTVHALQSFEFNLGTRVLAAANPQAELLAVDLAGVPLGWLQPAFPELVLAGSDVRGRLVATPRAGGVTVHSQTPLTVEKLAIARQGKPWITPVDVSLNASVEYSPQAWQIEVSGLSARSSGRTLLLLDAKAGRILADDQPVKATGLLTADVAALLTQPAVTRRIPLVRGDAAVEFVASLGATKQVQAHVTLKDLEADPKLAAGPLPAITTNLRADFSPSGQITFNAPVVLTRAGRTSDVTIAGTVDRGATASHFDGEITSNSLTVGDATPLWTVIQAGAPPAEKNQPPFWSGWNGTLALRLKNVVYSDAVQMANVVGKLRLADGAVTFEGVQAGVGETGEAKATGKLVFDAAKPRPFALGADVAVTDLDLGPWLRTGAANVPPVVEGRFVITTRLIGAAAALDDLGLETQADVTSKGGTFRGLPVSVGNLVENSGKLSSWIASAGNAITSLAGRKDYDEITSRSQAANELAKLLAAIPYDQLGLVLSTDRGIATIREFTLISPDLRLTGSGRVFHVPGRPLADDSVEFDFRLRARGRPAELMKYLGVLDGKPDDLGYAACTIPVRVSGTIARLDATELSNRLVALAVAKTGLTEKAVDWINRLRGR